MARPDKSAAVAELADRFRSANGAVLTEYRGLSVKQLQELRRALGANATYAVAKNTLAKIAAREAGTPELDDLLSGPTAIAFIDGDPVETARSLRDFSRGNDPLVIKGGFLEGKSLDADEIRRLADLESREVLLGRLAGGMKGNLAKAAALFNAPLAQAARAVGALQAKAEQDPSVLPAGTGQPADQTPSEAPADDTTSPAPADDTTSPAPADDTTSPAPADESTEG